MTTTRRRDANRRNARASTGPRTSAGKARAAQNARRHGLSLPARYDPSRFDEIEALARAIAGADASWPNEANAKPFASQPPPGILGERSQWRRPPWLSQAPQIAVR